MNTIVKLGLSVALIVVSACGCSLDVRPAPPMRRQVETLAKGSFAVLTPKITTPDGKVYFNAIFDHEIARYDEVLGDALASSLELTGIVDKATHVNVPSENLMSWARSKHAAPFQFAVVTELTKWDGDWTMADFTFLNPLNLACFFGVSTVCVRREGRVGLNIQLLDLVNQQTVIMAAPEVEYEAVQYGSLYSGRYNTRVFLERMTQKLLEKVRQEFEGRLSIYAAERKVVPYTWLHSGKVLKPLAVRAAPRSEAIAEPAPRRVEDPPATEAGAR